MGRIPVPTIGAMACTSPLSHDPLGSLNENHGRAARATRTQIGRILMRLFCSVCLTLASSLLIGCGTPSFLVTPISHSSELNEETVQPGKGWSPPKVAIIE